MSPLFPHRQPASPLYWAVLAITVAGLAAFGVLVYQARARYVDEQHALLATTYAVTLQLPVACRYPAAPGDEMVIRVRRNALAQLQTTCSDKPQWRYGP